MDVVVVVVVGLFALFVIGRLGAIAVPGPDPIPAWLTILFGFGAAVIGGGIGYASAGPLGFLGGSTIVAAATIVLYRRLFQSRGITGREAWKYPTQGFGVAKIRARLGLVAATTAERQLEYLEALHEAGILTLDELKAKQELVRGRARSATSTTS